MSEAAKSDGGEPGLFLPAAGDGPSPTVSAAIRAAVAADLRPERVLSLRTRILLASLAAIAACTLAAVSFGKKPGAIVDHPAEDVVALVVLALSGVLVVLGLTPDLRIRFSPRTKGFIVAALVVGWYGYLIAIIDPSASGPHAKAASCLAVSTLAGAMCIAAGLYLFRKTNPFAPRRCGALIGALAGLTGAAGVGITCVYHEGGHLAVGHGLVVPLLAIAGFAIGKRVLEP